MRCGMQLSWLLLPLLMLLISLYSVTSLGEDGSRHRRHGHHTMASDTTYYDYYDYDAPQGDYSEGEICPRCVFREEVKRVRIESIKQQILDKLRLDAPPNVDSRLNLPNAPDVMNIVDQFDMQGDSPGIFDNTAEYEEEDYYADTIRTFVMANPPPEQLLVNYSNAIHFDYTAEIGKSIRHVKLHVYVRPMIAMEEFTSIYIRYYRLAAPTPESNVNGLPVKQNRRGWFYEKKHLVPIQGDWYTLDIKEWVRDWTRDPSTNFGMVVEAVDSVEDPQVVSLPNKHTLDRTYVPFLQIRLSDQRHRRQKREVESLSCNERSREQRCCKFPLEVDFHAMGWHFILSPQRYSANYCAGDCPFVFQQQYPHTHVVHQSQQRGAGRSNFEGPCCNPTKMGEMSVLYSLSNGSLSLGKIPGMSVLKCGCS